MGEKRKIKREGEKREEGENRVEGRQRVLSSSWFAREKGRGSEERREGVHVP